MQRRGWCRRRGMVALALTLLLALGIVLLPHGVAETAFSGRPSLAVPPSARFARGVVLVRRRPGVDLARLAAAGVDVTSATALSSLGIDRLRVPPGQELAVVNRLRSSGLVDDAEPDYVRHVALAPNDPLYVGQWALPRIDAPTAWETTEGTTSVIVAVIDTGIDLTHPDRPVHLVAGPTYSSLAAEDGCPPEGVAGPIDDYGHGTHVAGIVAAATDNGTGVAGLAPGVTLLVIKAGDCVGNLADSDVALALGDAVAAGARVVNMSFGGPGNGSTLCRAVENAWASGAVLVAAAGNDGSSEAFYPADLPNVLGVSATDPTDTLAWFSNYGTAVALAAPGVGITSTVPLNAAITFPASTYYYPLSGTSMATPHVAGVAALVFSAVASLANVQVVAALEAGAVHLGSPTPNVSYGYGRIDAAGALDAARQLLQPALRPASATATLRPQLFFPWIGGAPC